MNDWKEIARAPQKYDGLSQPVSSVAFDTNQELLWVGNEHGVVASFHGPELSRYTKFRSHTSRVHQILPVEKGILSLSNESVQFNLRRGPVKWKACGDELQGLQCMSELAQGSPDLLAAGHLEKMLLINQDRGAITDKVPARDPYTIMRRARHICMGAANGYVSILDSRSLKIVHRMKAHSGPLADLDAKENTLLTCGYSPRHSSYILDPLVKVFDLRMLRSLPPLSFPGGPSYVRLHPKISVNTFVASQSGSLQSMDISNPLELKMYQANVPAYVTSFEISPSGDCLALGDGAGGIQLWSPSIQPQFEEFLNPLENADIPTQTPHVEWYEDTPLNMIGMPFYREELLSSWPNHMIFEVKEAVPDLDPKILSTLQVRDGIRFAKWPRDKRRNLAQESRSLLDANRSANIIGAPKFHSEKLKELVFGGSGRVSLDDIPDDTQNGPIADVPKFYRQVAIQYSKFGVEDFDFGFFNKTPFSGLETQIPNSHCNPLLQLLFYAPLIRNHALVHCSSSCLYEDCLLCDLGFLFDMLSKAQGQNCQASNFLRNFGSNPQVFKLQLLDDNTRESQHSYSTLIQATGRFLMERLAYESQRASGPGVSNFSQMAGFTFEDRIACMCGAETHRNGISYTVDLSYPQGEDRFRFCAILQHSLEREMQTKGWCGRCRRYQTLIGRRQLRSLPETLTVSASVFSESHWQQWTQPNWPPLYLGMSSVHGRFLCTESNKEDEANQVGQKSYELTGMIIQVHAKGIDHLVSLIKIPKSERVDGIASPWYLFNDFLVRNISEEEVLTFSSNWKVPSVLIFQPVGIDGQFDKSAWKNHLDTRVLLHDFGNKVEGFRSLSSEEEIKQGTLISLDAEFVALQQEETEIRSNGVKSIISPTRLTLARVSVLRGTGESQDQPFVDDYIITTEPVVDYLTEFSGISAGDLNPTTSRHTVLSQKLAYKKLWLLLNMGCIFVGHGLPKDFRIISELHFLNHSNLEIFTFQRIK